MWTRGGAGSCRWKKFEQVCAQNYYGEIFIAPSQGPIPGPIPDPGPIGDWGGNLWGLCGIKFSRPPLWSLRWPKHVLVKGISQFLLPWFESGLWVQWGYSSWACHLLREQTEKTFYVARVSAYRAYLYFTSPNNPGAYHLVHSCMCPHLSLQIWCQWWHQWRVAQNCVTKTDIFWGSYRIYIYFFLTPLQIFLPYLEIFFFNNYYFLECIFK